MLYVIQVCCVYSEKLLMMDRGTARNIEINLIIVLILRMCCLLLLLSKLAGYLPFTYLFLVLCIMNLGYN